MPMPQMVSREGSMKLNIFMNSRRRHLRALLREMQRPNPRPHKLRQYLNQLWSQS